MRSIILNEKARISNVLFFDYWKVFIGYRREKIIMSTSEVKEIVRSEIKKVFKEELANHLKTAMRNGDLKKDTNKLIKDALTELYKFMWVRKSVWQGEIGR